MFDGNHPYSNGTTRNVTFKFEDSDDVTSMDGDDRSRIQYTSTKSDDINSLVGIDRTRILYTFPNPMTSSVVAVTIAHVVSLRPQNQMTSSV